MGTNRILNALRIITNIGFYALILIVGFFVVKFVLNIFNEGKTPGDKKGSGLKFEMMAFYSGEPTSATKLSRDGRVSFQQKNQFSMEVSPRSSIGYSTFCFHLFQMLFGLAILYLLRKLFRQLRAGDIFKEEAIRLLKLLAGVFIVSDLVKIVEYIMVNALVRRSISSPHFALVTTIGNGIITGMIILVIAFVYQRGVALQEEHELTV
jgi:hypothetical protein